MRGNRCYRFCGVRLPGLNEGAFDEYCRVCRERTRKAVGQVLRRMLQPLIPLYQIENVDSFVSVAFRK
jgi:hypothetical protein